MQFTILLRLLVIGFICTPMGCGPSSGEGSYTSIIDGAKGRIEAIGGKAERKMYSALGYSVDGWSVDLSRAAITDETFEALRTLDRVCGLTLCDSDLSDAHMKHFADVKWAGSLVDLDLSRTRITDAGLAQLSESLYLSKLGLAGTAVTDAGLKAWRQKRISDARVIGPFKKVDVMR